MTAACASRSGPRRQPIASRARIGPTVNVLRRLVPTALIALLAAPATAQSPGAPDVRDLPLVEVPAVAPVSGVPDPGAPVAGAGGQTASLARRSLAVFLTGDGDWAAIDRGIADAVAGGGVPVVGLRVRAYLERGPHGRRTPDGLTRDVERVVRAYAARWGRDRVVLLGYSRGADYVPFVVNRLAPDLRARVALVGLFAADRDASFEFHFVDLLVDRHRASDVPVGPELARMLAPAAERPGPRALCVYGADEADSPCRGAAGPALRRVERGAGHHLDKNYPALGRLALVELARAGRDPCGTADA